MTYDFGSIISRAFQYANTALPKFSSWFWMVLFSVLFVGGSVLASVGVAFLMTSSLLLIPDLFASIGFTDNGLGLILGSFGAVFIVLGSIIALIFFFFVTGFFVRACKGKDLSLDHPWKMFGQGFLGFIISFIYMLPASIISSLLYQGPVGNTAYFVICGVIIPILLLIVSSFFLITAVVRYAKTDKFSAAFHLRTIGKIISSAGWLRYFGFLLLFSIILIAVAFVFCIVPVVGLLMLAFAMPFIMVLEGGFYAELYDCGNEYLDVKIE